MKGRFIMLYAQLNEVESLMSKIESVKIDGNHGCLDTEVGYSLRKDSIILRVASAVDVFDDNDNYFDTIRFVVKVPVENPADFSILLPAKFYDRYGLKDELKAKYKKVLDK